MSLKQLVTVRMWNWREKMWNYCHVGPQELNLSHYAWSQVLLSTKSSLWLLKYLSLTLHVWSFELSNVLSIPMLQFPNEHSHSSNLLSLSPLILPLFGFLCLSLKRYKTCQYLLNVKTLYTCKKANTGRKKEKEKSECSKLRKQLKIYPKILIWRNNCKWNNYKEIFINSSHQGWYF